MKNHVKWMRQIKMINNNTENDKIKGKYERRHWCHSGISIVDFEHISYFFQMFLMITLNWKTLMQMMFRSILINQIGHPKWSLQ